MARGVVKWFSDKKGFGFIVDPAVNGDVFVHFSAILSSHGRRTLEQGETVEYELYEDQKGSRARNVIRVEGGALPTVTLPNRGSPPRHGNCR
jgi:CspA family cold shock protein